MLVRPHFSYRQRFQTAASIIGTRDSGCWITTWIGARRDVVTVRICRRPRHGVETAKRVDAEPGERMNEASVVTEGEGIACVASASTQHALFVTDTTEERFVSNVKNPANRSHAGALLIKKSLLSRTIDDTNPALFRTGMTVWIFRFPRLMALAGVLA